MGTKNQIRIFLAVALLIAMYWGGNILNQRAIAYTNNQNQIQYIQQLEQKNQQLEGRLQELKNKIEEIKIEELKAEVR